MSGWCGVAGDRTGTDGASGTSDLPVAEAWADRFADLLHEPALNPTETGQVLKLAREVAHGGERRLAPLAAYLAGIYVGRRTGEGSPREEALVEAARLATSLLPDSAPRGAGGSAPSTED